MFLKQLTSLGKSVGDATLKFEPFILHVQCKKLEDAQLLVTVTLHYNETGHGDCLKGSK